MRTNLQPISFTYLIISIICLYVVSYLRNGTRLHHSSPYPKLPNGLAMKPHHPQRPGQNGVLPNTNITDQDGNVMTSSQVQGHRPDIVTMDGGEPVSSKDNGSGSFTEDNGGKMNYILYFVFPPQRP